MAFVCNQPRGFRGRELLFERLASGHRERQFSFVSLLLLGQPRRSSRYFLAVMLLRFGKASRSDRHLGLVTQVLVGEASRGSGHLVRVTSARVMMRADSVRELLLHRLTCGRFARE